MDYDACASLPAMFFDRTGEMGDRAMLAAKRDGDWRHVTAAEARTAAAALAAGLRSLGVAPGDRIALLSESRPEWMIADVAIMATGAISVPLYVTNKVADHRHVLEDCGAKGAVVSGQALAGHLMPAASGLEFVVSMEPLDGETDGVRVELWDDLVGGHDGSPPDLSGIARGDTCCLIYTSGTGGAPKGVMLSHGAILSNCKGAHDCILELGLGNERFLSFLPLSHSYEHTAGLFFPLSIKAEIYYAESVDRLAANMEEVRPTIMTAVPRLYEAMYGRIVKGLRQKGGLSEKLFMKAVDIGRRRYENGPVALGERVLDRLLDRLVRAKVAARFGGRLKVMVSGGAPLNYDIGIFFQALGVPMVQGYGMTEAAPVISCNRPGANRIRTVGKPVVDTEVRIADDGEILVRGELVMNGYWGKPEATAETVKDGWLHTGDVGEFDEDGYLLITDRKKDLIVNSGGDNISPQRIEGLLTIQPEILQAMVSGDRRPYLVALIVPDPQFAAEWAKAGGGSGDLGELVEDAGFRKAVSEAVDRVNAGLSVIERVRRHVLAAEPFTIENDMMTPSMKIRRHVIREKFGDDLEALYG